MGKRKRLNRFITKWIKRFKRVEQELQRLNVACQKNKNYGHHGAVAAVLVPTGAVKVTRVTGKIDLPDDRSTVLLLGVTRIPTTPTPARRPCSLPLGTTTSSLNPLPQIHPTIQPKSRRNSYASQKGGGIIRRNSSKNPGSTKNPKSKRRVVFDSHDSSSTDLSSPDTSAGADLSSSVADKPCNASGSYDITPSNVNSSDFTPGPMMDRSVDSIGACSLDAEASVDLTDFSEQSSVGTLRSLSLPTPEPQPHLPSYLSLACTVSGYSTTTNYDPERLARSRDASPHRLYDDVNSATPQNRSTPLYSIRNNLLSPPNVVPLPHHKYTPNSTPDTPKVNPTMEEQLVTRREFYSSSTKTTNFMSSESRNFVTSMFSTDSVDACIENGLVQNGTQSKCVSFETKTSNYITNGSGKSTSETSYKEFTNGAERKSFIQQRVERLYGPGALAQGFFISKRQKNRLSESDNDKAKTDTATNDRHSKSLTDKLLDAPELESNLKQSTSSPTLPVLRHLRPEFRAQLPIISQKKGGGVESTLIKSSTVPALKEETAHNGHLKSIKNEEVKLNGNKNVIVKEDETNGDGCEKDGHYFLQVLEKESKRLLQLADKVEKELDDPNLSEEVKGKLRAAMGKGRLLVSQKMQQFKGLCTNNITQREGEAFPTTNADLQGFWDMVLLQVEQVDAIFKEIDELKANGWEEIIPVDKVDKPNGINGNANKPRKIINRVTPTSAANEEARKQREVKRKQMIEEKRRAMREKTHKSKDVEIYVPESS